MLGFIFFFFVFVLYVFFFISLYITPCSIVGRFTVVVHAFFEIAKIIVTKSHFIIRYNRIKNKRFIGL